MTPEEYHEMEMADIEWLEGGDKVYDDYAYWEELQEFLDNVTGLKEPNERLLETMTDKTFVGVPKMPEQTTTEENMYKRDSLPLTEWADTQIEAELSRLNAQLAKIEKEKRRRECAQEVSKFKQLLNMLSDEALIQFLYKDCDLHLNNAIERLTSGDYKVGE